MITPMKYSNGILKIRFSFDAEGWKRGKSIALFYGLHGYILDFRNRQRFDLNGKAQNILHRG